MAGPKKKVAAVPTLDSLKDFAKKDLGIPKFSSKPKQEKVLDPIIPPPEIKKIEPENKSEPQKE
jgi:hypothetical protein